LDTYECHYGCSLSYQATLGRLGFDLTLRNRHLISLFGLIGPEALKPAHKLTGMKDDEQTESSELFGQVRAEFGESRHWACLGIISKDCPQYSCRGGVSLSEMGCALPSPLSNVGSASLLFPMMIPAMGRISLWRVLVGQLLA
jgi:hypothetical protein